jgi:DNA repair protein RecO (recombination protein O)
MPSNTRLYKTEAIILRQRRVGEADRFLTIYTPGLGKFDVKAKGVRKTTSRMSGHLQPLSHCMLQIAQGHSMDVVTGVETLASFGHLREDLDRLSLALYAAELTDRITPERATSFPSFRLFLDALQRLDREADGWAALRYFEMQLLGQAGFRPAIEACVVCVQALEPVENFFAPLAGGAVCRGCAGGLAGPRLLTLNALKFLRLLQRGSYNDVARVSVAEGLGDEVERHLRSYIITILERDVNAAAFIERLRKDRNTRPRTLTRTGQAC